MIPELLWLILHTIGLAVGVGAATASDPLFINSIRNRRISSDQLVLIETLSKVVLAGLTLLVISGIGLLWLSPELITRTGFLAKMTIVFVLAVDGAVFHFKVIPLLEDRVDERLDDELICDNLPTLSASGAISSTSWYSALILAMLLPFDLPYLMLMNIYLILVVGAVIGAYLVLSHLLFTPQPEPDEMVDQARNSGMRGVFGWLPLAVAVVILTIIGLGVTAIATPDPVSEPEAPREGAVDPEH